MGQKEFLSLLKLHQSIIYKLVHLYANSEEDKKDFYQEIVLQAWKSYPSFKGDSKFSTWLYSICLHTIFTLIRKSNRIDYTDNLRQYEHHLLETVNDEQEQLYQAVRSLPEVDKALVTLHLEGYSNQEIAEIMGISANNAGVKLHRAKQLLTKFLNQ